MGRLLDVDVIRERALALHEGRAQPVVPGYETYGYQLPAHQQEATR